MLSGAKLTALSGRSSLLIPLFLFGSTAAFTLWRNTQVGVLVDLGYVLNTATRIAAGDVPYAQFPLVLVPGEFLVQAALIKTFGPHFLVEVAYATILGGIATTLAYLIARRLLEPVLPQPRATAAILALPLVPLGIYAIYPHPFYDSDTCLAVLIAIAATLTARDRPTTGRSLLAGGLTAVPVVIKQNIGGAFLVFAVAALAAESLAQPSRRHAFRWFIAGLAAMIGLELCLLQLFVGLDHFFEWTWGFAVGGRGVTLTRMRDFLDPLILWPAALLLLLTLISRRLEPRHRGPLFLAGLIVPLAVGVLAPETFIAVPRLFPPVLLAASVLAVISTVKSGISFEGLLPLVVAGTTLGAVASHDLNGSTYGIFPLLVLAVASLVRDLSRLVERPARIAPLTGLVVAAILTVFGSAYTLMNFRLAFIDANAPGPVVRSAFPSLAGLSARGPYIADLDAMLFWARDNVRAGEPAAFLPGEEPAFYALGWRPRLPSVYFYDVANPYTPAEIARFADDVGLRWVFVKDRLQLVEEPPLQQQLVAALIQNATLVTRIGPYRIYRR